MRKVFSVLMLWAVCWTVGGRAALADGMILPPAGVEGAGYLAVVSHHVTVTIEGDRAVTRVEQEFSNPYDVVVSGRYLFPLPPEAVVSRFEAEVDGQAQAATRQDSVATEAELRAAIVERGDPSLLQYAGWESLAFDLDLAPGGRRIMRLEYEEALAPRGGLYRYRYVLSTERYSSLPLEAASITVEVSASPGLAGLYSPSHDVAVERLGAGRVRLRWEARDVRPGTDFELFFAPAADGFGGGLLTGGSGGDGEDGHFLFLFSPEVAPPAGNTIPKDIVFVLDRSGSMSGVKIEQAQDALLFILDQLGEADRFSIISFDDQVSVLERELQPVDWRTLDAARRYVYQISADGSTDLEAALQAALGILGRSESRGVPRMVVFLTDGLPTAGITDEATIARRVAETNARLEARLHVSGVGYDVNTHLLDRLAADAGGTVAYVQPGENLEARLTGFYGTIAHPLLTDLEVEFEGLEVSDLYPGALPDLFRGSRLLLSGRYRAQAQAVTVRVRGRAGGEVREYVYHYDLAATRGADADTGFVARLWATRRTGALLDRVRVEGESSVLVAEVRALGLRYGLVTPYTTFVVEARAGGAASAANMDLYGRADLNAASGETTVQARVQNQMYQEAARADLAAGANVSSYGRHSLAQVGAQQVDLSLLAEREVEGPLSAEWLVGNVEVDRTIEFGSDEYWDLAADPAARAFLQSGTNVVFAYGAEVLAVRGPEGGGLAVVGGQVVGPAHDPLPAGGQLAPGRLSGQPALPIWPFLLLGGIGLLVLAGASGLVALVYVATRSRS
jgi:Ca-activated chloride channel family protein